MKSIIKVTACCDPNKEIRVDFYSPRIGMLKILQNGQVDSFEICDDQKLSITEVMKEIEYEDGYYIVTGKTDKRPRVAEKKSGRWYLPGIGCSISVSNFDVGDRVAV